MPLACNANYGRVIISIALHKRKIDSSLTAKLWG